MEQSTLLGSAWVLLHPLIVLSVLSLVFKACEPHLAERL